MALLRFMGLSFFLMQSLVSIGFTQTDTFGFMTSRDLLRKDPISNINLHNSRNAAASVYGLYVRQFAYVTPGDTCDHATVIYTSSQNTTAGSFVMPTLIGAGQSAAIGGNYLYNMIYQVGYYIGIIFPMSPPGCALPGCTWGSDSTIYNWCIYLGALAPVSTSAGYTANVPPSTDVASSTGIYNYNLINSYLYLGPISCNDRTLTCTVSNQQTQSFS